MNIYLPIRTESEANRRDHWAVKARRAKQQRYAAGLLVRQKVAVPEDITATITLTRIAPRPLDNDNLARSMKAVRDGIADALGVDDGDARFTWEYGQRKGEPKEYAVEVEVEVI